MTKTLLVTSNFYLNFLNIYSIVIIPNQGKTKPRGNLYSGVSVKQITETNVEEQIGTYTRTHKLLP